MNAIKIHDHGVMLKGPSEGEAEPLPQQAFTISLDDDVIEGMIKCVQNGGEIELALGSHPTFEYGTRSHRISAPSDDHPHDLYLTNPYNTIREGTQIPTMSLFRNPKLNRVFGKSQAADSKAAAPKQKSSRNSSTASSLDSDIEALQHGMAAQNAAKEKSLLISGPLPANKKAAAKMKNNHIPWGNSNRSLSTSPALKPIPSPSTDPADLTKRTKELRAPLVHELAVKDQTRGYLREKWDGKAEDFQAALDKVADPSNDAKTWTLRKAYWKELDVWRYDYDHDEDRQQAIKNAIKQYDKQRLSASEPEWERLNPKSERGKGICLSNLQANLARGPVAPAPKIKVQKADDSSASTSTSKDDADGSIGHRPKLGGESMARSSSNPLPKNSKKSASEAQAKRLLSTSKTKAAPQKTSPTKAKTSTKANGGRGALSQEIIENSDSSGDEAPLANSKPAVSKPKPAKKPAEKPVKRWMSEKQAAAPKPKPVARDPVQPPAPKQAPKRPLEDDDDSTSSSGSMPLAQRYNKQQLPHQSVKKRNAEFRSVAREPREPPPSSYNRNKNTSPTKSSPLASSPPTNATDMSDDERASKKRKAEADRGAPPAKRRAAEVPADVLTQAQKFKTAYSKYEALHHEISALDHPSREKLERLSHMRDRLADMKARIYKQCQG